MRKLLLLLFIIIPIQGNSFFPHILEERILLLAAEDDNQLPRHFRIITDLSAAGSAEFSQSGLQQVKSLLPDNTKITVLDLKQESHIFVDGNALSLYDEHNWVNLGKTDKKIREHEQELKNHIEKGNFIRTNKVEDGAIISVKLPVKNVATEMEMVEQSGLSYLRINVLDHKKPSDKAVNQFVELVKNMPSGEWLYIHCDTGKGRTTTFLAIYDMMLNAKNKQFDVIIKSQYELGGADLAAIPEEDWKKPLAKERMEFLKSFYNYAKTNEDGFVTSWTDWKKANAKKTR